MENSKLKFNVCTDKEGIVTIREGAALPLREPTKVNITGTIDAIQKYLAKRLTEIEQKACMIIVDRDNLCLELIINEHSFYKDNITSQLLVHADFLKWNINTGETWSTKKLSEFIKMNRACFEDKKTAMLLSSELNNLKIKVEKELEKSDDNRGTYKVQLSQNVIKNSIPERFILAVPIFKGMPKNRIEIEIYIDPETYSITLVSPEANDIVTEVRDKAIDDQLKAIEIMAPDIVVIEK